MTAERGSRPQAPKVGVKEVAERAGVAISSVSRVLSGHPSVSDEMRERVLTAARELSYQPNMLARSLRRGATLTIGFVVRDISNPILAEIALGAETELSRAGYAMLLANSHGIADRDAAGINLFRRRRVDGLMLSLADEQHRPTLDEIELVENPIVLVDRQIATSGRSSIASVLADHAAGARAAVDHLIGLGHRHLGLITGADRILPMRVIPRVMTEMCAAAGVDLTIEVSGLLPGDGADQIRRMFATDRRPTAILTASNQMLVGVVHTLRELGLRVPTDVSLVTFDDVALLDIVDPPVAVISRQPFLVGQHSARLILDQLRGRAADGLTVTVPSTFEPRASMAPPP